MTDTPLTILVADDEPPIRLLVRVNLEAEGHSVIEAGDGVATLEAVRSHHPDVVLLDVMMPAKDGWEVAEEMLADDVMASIPIIFLTARADLRDHERGLTSGAIHYITKPFNPRELASTIVECVEASRAGNSEQVREARMEQVRRLQQRGE